MRCIPGLAVWGLLVIGLTLGCGKAKPPSSVPGAVPASGAELPPSTSGAALIPVPHIEPRWPALHVLGMKEVTIDALARIGRSAVPALVQVLRDSDDAALREQAAQALARMGPDAAAAVPPLIAALDDPDETVRKNAIRALGQIGPPAAEAVPTLIDVLKRLELSAPKTQ